MILAFTPTILFSQITKCGDKVCVDMPIMDTLIWHDIAFKELKKDTAEYKAQIRSKNDRIANLKANEDDLKDQVKTNKILANNYQTTAQNFQDKYGKEKDKAKFRGKVLIGSLVLNLAFIATAIVLFK